MKVTAEKMDNHEVVLTIEVESEVLKKAESKACKDLANREHRMNNPWEKCLYFPFEYGIMNSMAKWDCKGDALAFVPWKPSMKEHLGGYFIL